MKEIAWFIGGDESHRSLTLEVETEVVFTKEGQFRHGRGEVFRDKENIEKIIFWFRHEKRQQFRILT